MKPVLESFPARCWPAIGFISIILLTVLLRFYNYDNRWGLAYDQARDALIAREALRQHTLPLLGPFSSAGPFQTGGEWFWFVMLGTAINPQSVLSPWVTITIMSVIFVAFIMYVSRLLGGINLALIAGMLSAVSTAETAQSTNLTNPTPLSLITLCAIWAMIRFIRKKDHWALFLLGFFVGLAISFHLQGVTLLFLLGLTLLFNGFRSLPLALAGLFIPFIPMLIYDSQNNFANFRNMYNYYFHNSNAISYEQLGRRWLTYVLVFWPAEWSHVVGGFLATGVASMLLVVSAVTESIYKIKFTKELLILTLSLLFSIFLLRYVRAPLFSSYLMFSHPFILILVSWSILKLANAKIWFGLLLFLLIFGGSFLRTWNDLSSSTNTTAREIKSWIAELDMHVPSEKYAIYDKKYEAINKSVPLSLFLDVAGKSSITGTNIGVGFATVSGSLGTDVFIGRPWSFDMVNLASSTSAQLDRDSWYPVDARSIYLATEEWRRLEAKNKK